MLLRRLIVPLMLLLSSSAVVRAAEDPYELFDARKYAAAYSAFVRLVEAGDRSYDTLYAAGLAAYLSGHFKEARDLWLQAEQTGGESFTLAAKLVQAHQALNEEAGVNRNIEKLRRLRAAGQKDDSGSSEFFCRHQARIGRWEVQFYEYFEYEGEHAKKYSAFCVNPSSGDIELTIRFGSDELVNLAARASGRIESTARTFQLEAAFPQHRRIETYIYTDTEMPFADFVENVGRVIRGELTPQSATQKAP